MLLTFDKPLAKSQRIIFCGTRSWKERVLEYRPVPHVIDSEVHGQLGCLLKKRITGFFV